MTSSVQDFSDNNGTDEQLKQLQSDNGIQSHVNGNFQPGVALPSAGYIMPPNHLEVGNTMASTSYPYIDPYFGSMIAAYAGQPVIHPNMMGVQQPVMPLPTGAFEPVYVNAKQYRGILRRRESRAKAEAENKLIKSRKPYLHESRHLHALKRARGCGGRFVNSKSDGSGSNSNAESRDVSSPENQDNVGASENRES